MSLPSPRPCTALVAAASAGGLPALEQFLLHLDAAFTAPILIAHHIHSDTENAVPLLRGIHRPMEEGADALTPQPGHIYFAPAGYHMEVEASGNITLSLDPKIHCARPSADMLFFTAAEIFRDGLLAVVFSGAGMDGAAGSARVLTLGGRLFVQSPESCAIPSMPEATIAACTTIEAIATPAALATHISRIPCQPFRANQPKKYSAL